MSGITRTRVGYAGGSTPDPTHKKMGDHTETVQIDFNPAVISYEEILHHFWRHHNPNRKKYRDREYISLVLYHNEKQKRAAQVIKKQLEEVHGEQINTEMAPYKEFTEAAERQQKWNIKRAPIVLELLNKLYPDERQFVDSTLVTRLNSLAKGYGSTEEIQREINQLDMEEHHQQQLLENVRRLDK